MAAKAIPPILIGPMLEQAALGTSGRDLAKWLLAEHGIKCSHKSVLKTLARATAERKPIADAVIAEKLGKTVGKDLDVLDGALQRALRGEALAWKMADEAEDPGEGRANIELALKAQDRLVKHLEMRFKLSGASSNAGDEKSFADLVLEAQRRREAMESTASVVEH